MNKLKLFTIIALLCLGSLAAFAGPTWQKVTSGAGGIECGKYIDSTYVFSVPRNMTVQYSAVAAGGGGSATLNYSASGCFMN